MTVEVSGQRRILVVDDERMNLSLLDAMLVPMDCRVTLARSGAEALELARGAPFDLVLLDVMMPRMDGFEVARRLKGTPETRNIPVVMVTALAEVKHRVAALEAGADDFLTKPVDLTELQTRVRTLLKVKAYNDSLAEYQRTLELEVEKKTAQLGEAFRKLQAASLETIYRLSRAAEHKDEDTGAHIQRMSHYAAAVGRRMALPEDEVEAILSAAPMHDIGKIGIPDRILLKPGPLDPEEWKLMRQHTVIGGRILEGSREAFIEMGETVALAHHEKWDGSGYPRGLKGAEIPLVGRVVAIADVFDALTSRRPYKEPFTVEKSLGIIREGRGRHFDPDVVDAFFAVQPEILEIKERYKDAEAGWITRV